MRRCRKIFSRSCRWESPPCWLPGALTGRTARRTISTVGPPVVSPAEMGKRVAENFVALELRRTISRAVVYQEVCTWYRPTVALPATTGKPASSKFYYHLTTEGASRISTNAHVDFRVFGIVPLEIYIQTRILGVRKKFCRQAMGERPR